MNETKFLHSICSQYEDKNQTLKEVQYKGDLEATDCCPDNTEDGMPTDRELSSCLRALSQQLVSILLREC